MDGHRLGGGRGGPASHLSRGPVADLPWTRMPEGRYDSRSTKVALYVCFFRIYFVPSYLSHLNMLHSSDWSPSWPNLKGHFPIPLGHFFYVWVKQVATFDLSPDDQLNFSED